MQLIVPFLLIAMLSSTYVRSYQRQMSSSLGGARFRTLSSVLRATDKVFTLEPSNQANNEINHLFPPDSAPLSSLIHLNSLRKAMTNSIFEKASAIQQQSYEPIFSGKDVIVGAETGSGKTLAYFLPLMDRHLSLKAEAPAAADPSTVTWEEAADKLQPIAGPQIGIILAPSNPLCDQVMSMVSPVVNKLKEDGVSVRLSRWSDSIFDKRDLPSLSIVICTPKVLANVLGETNHFDPEHPFRSLAFLVMDEADMLLDGSYLQETERVMDTVRLVRRMLISDGILKVHESHTQFVLSAATIPTMGLKSVAQYTKKAFPHAVYIRTDHMHHHHPSIRQQFIQMKETEVLSRAHADAVLAQLYQQHLRRQADASNTSPQSPAMPADHAWLKSLDYSVMIFLNTAASAQTFARLLGDAGVNCTEMHALVDKAARDANLQRFRDNQERVLVCTDACARGFDLPQVRVVVQAEFALNVVQHLHRIGRASRGGVKGEAVNFYTPAARLLVRSIVGASDLDKDVDVEQQELEQAVVRQGATSIEKSFSRRRGFRQKIKKAHREAAATRADTK